MERYRTEQLLEQMYQQLDDAISKKDQDVARYMYGQIAGALMLALYLRIISEQEYNQRFDALKDKFYDAF